MIDLGKRGAKRRHEDEGVKDRPGEQAVGAGGLANGFSEAPRGWKLFAAWLAEFYAGDESALADFMDDWVGGFERGESGAEAGDFCGEIFECMFLREDIEAGEGGSAAEGIGGVTMAIVKRVFRGSEECLIDGGRGECGGQWKGATGEAFGEAEEIRNHVFLLAGKQGAGAAETGHDLVEYEVDARFITPAAQFRKHAGGPWAHFIDTLDERFDNDASDFFRIEGAEIIQRTDVGDRVAVVFKTLEKSAHATEGGRAERVAVVAIGEGDEFVAPGCAGLHAELDRHFQGALDGGGAIIGEKNTLQRVLRKKFAQALGQFYGTGVGKSEERDVCGFFKLAGNGGGNDWVRVAVDVGPDGRISIKIAPTFGVPKPCALSVRDDQWLMTGGAPFVLTGERMPAVGLIGLDPAAGFVTHWRDYVLNEGGGKPECV